MTRMLVTRWDSRTRKHTYYNADGTTTTDLDDADVWDDEEAATLAAEEQGFVVLRSFDKGNEGADDE